MKLVTKLAHTFYLKNIRVDTWLVSKKYHVVDL